MKTSITRWKKSTRSGPNDNCVEISRTADGGAAVRDTKDRAAGHFTANGEQWSTFLFAIKDGRYHH
ncbi:DUF397 domain-containing protein [Saccharopolyspora sp. HNM0986]|nr:DUF397 domain-containing protein [Saccharopolyspora sp. HNM0986]